MLAELLVLLSALSIVVWCLIPRSSDPTAANAFADAQNLRQHGRWLQLHRDRFGGLPSEGGHRFVLAAWTAQLFEHTPEHLDRFFTPGTFDPAWKEAKDTVLRGENPWPTLGHVDTESTHYCGRAAQHLATATGADQACMADDNEGVWSLRCGTVNVLLGDGDVRTYSYRQLVEQFGVGDLDRQSPVPTWGPASPIPECRRLDN